MAVGDGGFKQVAFGFDKNEVNEYISDLRKKMKSMEEDMKSNNKKTDEALKLAEEADDRIKAAEKAGEDKLAEVNKQLTIEQERAAKFKTELDALKKELEQERKKVEAEENKYRQEMERIAAQMQSAHDAELDSLKKRLEEMQALVSKVEEKKAEIINLQNGKAGTVYIISNIGSFGDNVYKIGMTRRIEPQERVNELGDASVPFPFDVHSFIFSEDAVSLENALHKELNDRRVNKVNLRKEFFNVSIDELQTIVERIDPTAPFKVTALAEQYRQSLSITDVPLDIPVSSEEA